ncbi:iron-sulfur cluster carrier protein ApbC [Aliiglaciecola sp. LCG003]|uniref:iron-sulfur cluster carrier protein ApbC n=1 Tax=Aliiglaciecola sp. LCG003 TaxID=3053655 RepID=UPI002573EC0B|nr:iron-sulfur cluster carrier protein ApbC [Aliiglaciecola sp. LCG003]WJG10653.1 iron-sulfur cluster carrier protein ApbC [Aliiglaciecola sp. LCG003]
MSIKLSNAADRGQIYTAAATILGISEAQLAQCSQISGEHLSFALPFACQQDQSLLIDTLVELGMSASNIHFSIAIEAKQTKVKRLPRVKNIIAVASGKGGVGKSATSVNLAFALQAQGAKVGILDADIYGPSVPIMLGNPDAHPQSEDNRHMQPIECHGVVANSIGYLVAPDSASIWRGPMASKALQQLVNETLWPDLDYLIIDMPPGTGDIQLTLAQQVPVTAAVVVTTPQDIALADAIKGIAMFNKVNIPVLGVIENMSYYQCRQCGHKDFVFASGGGQKLASQYAVELLGQLPLDIQIRQHADGGEPLIVAEPDSEISQAYLLAAKNLSRKLAFNKDIGKDNSIQVVEKH